MVDRALEQIPLRELISHAEHLARDLIEHLDQSFLPRLQALDLLAHDVEHQEPAADISVRTKSTELLESDTFTQQKVRILQDHLSAIEAALRQRMSG